MESNLIGIWEGIYIFLMLSIFGNVLSVLIFGTIQLIDDGKGWEVFGWTILLFALIVTLCAVIFVGGDQIMQGFHQYG